MSKLADKILEKIETDNIEPVPVWAFKLRNWFFWGLWILSVVFGAVAISVILYVFLHAEWGLRFITHNNTWQFLLDWMPVFWLTAFLALLMVGFINFRKTKKGYRYPFAIVVSVNLISSFVIGVAFFFFGMGEVTETMAGKYHFYESVEEMREKKWNDVDKGLISGVPLGVEVNDGMTMVIMETFDYRIVPVNISDATEEEMEIINSHRSIAVIGINTDDYFYACAIMDWRNCHRENMEVIRERIQNGERINKCAGLDFMRQMMRENPVY